MNTSAICKEDQRRDAIRRKSGMNGLDYLDVGGDQLTLKVFFLGKAPSQLLKQDDEDDKTYNKRLKQYVHIEGGVRIREIGVTDVKIVQIKDARTGKLISDLDDWMEVRVNKHGDFSTYILRLVGVENIDPFYDHIDFSFKVDCPSDLDCAPIDTCPPPKLDEPEINYLAKDYASFRQLILDRLALIMPDWKERHIPDLGITLVELLAYVGDHLSYYQDAVATEAYLDTARQRISVRRHARLVDYHMHEGCNARAWVCIETDTDLTDEHAFDPGKIFFTTAFKNTQLSVGTILTADELQQIPGKQYEVFEPIATKSIQLRAAHSEIHFYTWGQRECCLLRGATSASLLDQWVFVDGPSDHDHGDHEDDHDEEDDHGRDHGKEKDKDKHGHRHGHDERNVMQSAKHKQHGPPHIDSNNLKRKLDLHVGDVLIFEEVIGPRTGVAADADPLRRFAVRLTRITQSEDPIKITTLDVNGEPYDLPTPVVDIEWSAEDALASPLCLTAMTDAAHGCHYVENVSIVRGNVVLVDHGRTQSPEDLGAVPCASTQTGCLCEDHLGDISFVPGYFRPQLSKTPLTFSEPLPKDNISQDLIVSAKAQFEQDMRKAFPQIWLDSTLAAPVADCEHLVPLFRLTDLINPSSLISTLGDTSNPVSQVLRSHLSKNTLELLDQHQEGGTIPSALSQAVIDDLEQLLLEWSVQFDMLNSGSGDLHFVVEMDNDGHALLRFGNGELGQLPEAGADFFATYRIGNGLAGNVGAETISHLVLRNTTVSGANLRVRNPLPAHGGTEPESMADVKLFAPFAFRKEIQRAIIAKDYAELTQRDFRRQLQAASATLAWTGSWYEAQVAVDPFGREEADAQLLDNINDDLYRYRRIGHDLAVSPAQYVPLDIEMIVCVLPSYLRGHVKAELLKIFSNRALPDGRHGLFHPDSLTFGEGIYLSKLVAAAQAVTGVESVKVAKLQRLYEGDQGELKDGLLRLGPLEIPRLDNDPSFPEHGRLVLDVRGER